MAFSWSALIAFAMDKLTLKSADDRIFAVEHRAVVMAVIEKMQELEQSAKSGLYVIGSVKAFSETNIPSLATAPAFSGIMAGDAVGIVAQANKVENGVYIYTGSGYRRATAADGFNPLVPGGLITSGTSSYVLRTRGTIAVGTTPQQWDPFYVNSGREETSDEYIPIMADSQKEYTLSEDMLKGGTIKRVWIDDPDKTKVVKNWTYDEEQRKLTIDVTYANRCRKGSELFAEIATIGTSGASYGFEFEAIENAGNTAQLAWRYANETSAKLRPIKNAILRVETGVRTKTYQVAGAKNGQIFTHNGNTDNLIIEAVTSNGTYDRNITAVPSGKNSFQLLVPEGDPDFTGKIFLKLYPQA
ncbi:hypothetical protein BWI93_05430 [Siphonobacter sp. BAB-5385]|uniref:hypothetical protein n=1 Tax=Siphonobacter sp. BAB-5385 TaxID=1864822 RepID=UPI000B9ED51D|nr:hypothetical protein [Siphonobacter sp. BAB-5385]OZI09189.1 hypothetical protein BWI93_05430 [Siphonobacter sp. BAB-5385]